MKYHHSGRVFVALAMAPLTMLLVTVWSLNASAQVWGAGVWGGTQACGYGMQLGDNATSVLDQIEEINDSIKEKNKELREKRKELREAKSKMQKAKSAIQQRLQDDLADFALARLQEDSDNCEIKVQEGAKLGSRDTAKAKLCASANPDADLKSDTCTNDDFAQEYTRGNKGLVSKCSDGLSSYKRHYKESKRLEAEIKNLEEEIKSQRKAKKDLSKDLKAAIKDDLEEASEDTEGNVCIPCLLAGNGGGGGLTINRGPSTGQILGNLALGAAAIAGGVVMNNYTNNINSRMGFPAQNSMSPWVYGIPYALGGLYGAMSWGGARGSFGCGGGLNGGAGGYGPAGIYGPYGANGGLYGQGAIGSPWGNPYMAASPFSGGMYMPGMLPGGVMAGPWSGSYNPYMMAGGAGIAVFAGLGGGPIGAGYNPALYGAGLPAGIGAAISAGLSPYGYNPLMAGGGGAYGIPGGLGIAISAGINPLGGGYNPLMAGYNPLYGGGIGSPIGLGAALFSGAGAPFGYYGGSPMLGAGGVPIGLGGVAGSLGGLQMQQAMMQAQMQAYQSAIAYQQQQQYRAAAQARVISGLQIEMQSLQTRLYQAYMGIGIDTGPSGFGSSYYVPSSYTPGGYNSGYSPGVYSPSNPYGRGYGTGR